MEYKYYLSQLNNEERALYTFMYEKILELADSFKVSSSIEIIQKALSSIMMDNPELFWFEGKWEAVYEDDGIVVIPKYKATFNHNDLHAEIKAKVQEITENTFLSDVMSVMSVYDWLVENVQYCPSANDQTIEGAFVDRKAVCKGIAKAFQLCMNKLGIPSFLIKGSLDNEASHIWNVIFINEKFYHVDVTMGYQRFQSIFESDRNKHYPCFMISTKTISRTHRIYIEQFPGCEEDFDLNSFLIKQLNIPPQLIRYGDAKYVDKGSTCTVLEITGESSHYALKIVDGSNNYHQYINACGELEKLNILSASQGVMNIIESDVDEACRRVYMMFKYYKSLSIRRKEFDFDPVKGTLMIGIDLLDSMIECQKKGIYHLDIQPKNIYFNHNNRAILGDFGNSAFEHELNGLEKRRGTFAFMAPEVYDAGIYSQASEIYSLGIVLYSLMNNAILPLAENNEPRIAIERRLNGECLSAPCNCNEIIWENIRPMCEYDLTKRYSTYEETKKALTTIVKNI